MRVTRNGIAACVIACAAWACAESSECTDGLSVACACADGRAGAQVCVDGAFGACMCGDVEVDAGLDASTEIPDAQSEMPDAQSDMPDAQSDMRDAGHADAGTRGTGHLVLIGHDLLQAFSQGDRVLGNAVALARGTGAIRVLDYTQYTDRVSWNPVTLLRPRIRDGVMNATGRDVTFTELTSWLELDDALDDDVDVLLVYAQSAERARMQTIAEAWHPHLRAFLARGGVIVVLDRTQGGSIELGFSHELVRGEGLFAITAVMPGGGNATPRIHDVALASDPIAVGVTSYSVAQSTCFDRTTGGDAVVQLRDTLCPVVLHGTRR
ncbi:hypothetical protein [Sandaracinus amylolyticus]|uniref:Uncharacterized protein n=1 Tax=Sandaracinus amylolyticus TaxID=927083 RepID=A0A0F6W8H5_9BACT|nr:hypothetical protein [Sandaracinus amylolyticus]AKF10181.1 hypothetical protein DB32_007330 [Sandaracinus amylolyticus]